MKTKKNPVDRMNAYISLMIDYTLFPKLWLCAHDGILAREIKMREHLAGPACDFMTHADLLVLK